VAYPPVPSNLLDEFFINKTIILQTTQVQGFKVRTTITGMTDMTATKQTNNDRRRLRHQAERITALKDLQTYYKEISETVREPFIILDKNLAVVSANQAFYRKFKVLKRDTIGKLMYKLGNNQWDTQELRELLEHILPKHRILNNYEITHDFPTLGRKTMLLNARQVDSKQLILLAIEDVTVLRKAKTDSDELTANLVLQRDKLQGLNDAKDEFISLASHQLRTPATVVKQYVGMLTHGYAGKLTPEQLAMLETINKSNERQLEVIEDLLRIAKVDAGKVYLEKSSCDVVKQMKVVIREQAILFKKRQQSVKFSKPPEPVLAFIDPKLMHMVLENLLDNAGKYSHNGGHIVVNVEQTDSGTVISIKDDGVGIRKKDLPKLFKKFSRIDNPLSASVKGTGLGLYWVKKILDLHGGSISVISGLNKGTTFTVQTPIETSL
jgi:two-component system cell cycle sensor histidine kinase PleC